MGLAPLGRWADRLLAAICGGALLLAAAPSMHPVASPGHGAGTAPEAAVKEFAAVVDGLAITQGFGPTDVTLEPPGHGYPHFHTGVDLAAAPGTAVHAAAAGRAHVVSERDASGRLTGYGLFVWIDDGNGFESLYAHLSEAAAVDGQWVRQGQLIGRVGSTGSSTGPHLHFAIRWQGQAVDPVKYYPLLVAS